MGYPSRGVTDTNPRHVVAVVGLLRARLSATGRLRSQNGSSRSPLVALIQIMSVKSARLSGPVRPQPLSRTPPIGAWSSSFRVGELMLTTPCQTFGASSKAL